jgi:hypothetical protein
VACNWLLAWLRLCVNTDVAVVETPVVPTPTPQAI